MYVQVGLRWRLLFVFTGYQGVWEEAPASKSVEPEEKKNEKEMLGEMLIQGTFLCNNQY